MGQFDVKNPRIVCSVCGKEAIVRSMKGKGSTGYCSRICAGNAKYRSSRFTGMRSGAGDRPDYDKLRNV